MLPHYLAKTALNDNPWSALIVTCEITINNPTCDIITFISGAGKAIKQSILYNKLLELLLWLRPLLFCERTLKLRQHILC